MYAVCVRVQRASHSDNYRCLRRTRIKSRSIGPGNKPFWAHSPAAAGRTIREAIEITHSLHSLRTLIRSIQMQHVTKIWPVHGQARELCRACFSFHNAQDRFYHYSSLLLLCQAGAEDAPPRLLAAAAAAVDWPSFTRLLFPLLFPLLPSPSLSLASL